MQKETSHQSIVCPSTCQGLSEIEEIEETITSLQFSSNWVDKTNAR